MSCNCDRNPDEEKDMDDMISDMRQQPDYFGGMVALTRDMFEESQAEKDAYVAVRIAMGRRDSFGNPTTKAEADLMAHEAYVEGLAWKEAHEATFAQPVRLSGGAS